MWTRTCHRFTNEAAFLAACDAAGWPRDHANRPAPPAALLSPLMARTSPAWDTLLADARYDGAREALDRFEQGVA